jgi:hypothetical protein
MQTWQKYTIGIAVLAGGVYVMTRPRTKALVAAAKKKLRGLFGLDQELPEVMFPDEEEEVTAEVEPTPPAQQLPTPQQQAQYAQYAYQQQQAQYAMRPVSMLPVAQPVYQAPSMYQQPVGYQVQPTMQTPYATWPSAVQGQAQYPATQYPMTQYQPQQSATATTDAAINWALQSGVLTYAAVQPKNRCGANNKYTASPYCNARFTVPGTKQTKNYTQALTYIQKGQFAQQGVAQQVIKTKAQCTKAGGMWSPKMGAQPAGCNVGYAYGTGVQQGLYTGPVQVSDVSAYY